MELSESTPLSIPNNNTNLIGYNNTDTISENKLDFQYHDQYLTEIDNDSTKHLLTTHDGGKPVKKPFLPNFRRMTKKEKVFTVLNTSKFLILTITFLLFGIFFSIHDETSSENTTHILALSNVSPIFLYFKSKDGPLERFTMNGEIPLLGNENLYELRKYHLENNLNIDWNITFQLQRSELQFDKLQNIENDIFEEENRYIDVVNETFTLPFVLKIQSKNNTVNKNQTVEEEEIQTIQSKFILQSDLSKLPTQSVKNILQLVFKHTVNDNTNSSLTYRLKIITNYPHSMFSFKMEVLQQPYVANYQTVFAAIILVLVYILIVFELIHRTMAAMIGSFLVLSVMSILNARPSLHEITSWIEYETIGLLFGMMVMVSIFSNTGFFEWTALQAYRLSKGKIWSLTLILCTFTGVISAFLDSVTTILLIAPVTIRLCKVLDITPVPIIIAEVILSSVGGTATAVGDPPIVILINHPGVKALGIGFFDISLYLAPCSLIIGILTFPVMRLVYWNYFKSNKKEELPADNERLHREKEIEIWEQTLKKTKGSSLEELKVKEQLENHILNLKKELNEYLTEKKKIKMEEGGESNRNGNQLSKEEMQELSEMYCIHNPRLFVICSSVLVITIAFFFIESFIHSYVHLNLAWIAIIGSVTMLLLAGINHEFDEILEKVEWSTLLFFAALFVLMEGLGKLGLVEFIGNVTSDLIASVSSDLRLFVAITLLLWVSAFVSAFIDNIPYVTAMIPVVLRLAEDPINLPIRPILWALALGTCLGGNGTLIGSSANVVAAGISENSGYPITFLEFMRLGMPAMIMSVFVANIYLVILHVAIGLT